ncbi:MAG: host-nuclease inhibitor Gam family protein [Verrucomicrobiota bacterium]
MINLATATSNESMTTVTLAKIDELAQQYAAARRVVSERVKALEAEIASLQRRRVGAIKVAAAEAADLSTELRVLIERAPHLFVRPKTLTLHGVTLGFRKGVGKMEWEDDAKVVALIRKHLPGQADVLIVTEEKPSADALKNLEARDLARIGVHMECTGDFVVVKSTDSSIDKLVTKILKEGAQAAEPAQ